MYACVQETAGGFFEGVYALSDQARISSDPPPPCHFRSAQHRIGELPLPSQRREDDS